MQKIFEEIVENYSGNIAIFDDECAINYDELNNQINFLAQLIMDKTEGNSYPIAFCVKRGIQSVVAMMGIIKANCYYVPLDPTYPANRIKMILNSVNPYLIISDNYCSSLLYKSQEGPIDHNNIIVLTDNRLNFGNYNNPIIANSCLNDIAYTIFTSGSTGTPKGVIIKQASVVNLINSAISILNITDKSKILHYTSIGFDAAGWDIYCALFSGATLYISSEEISINPPLCHQYIGDNGITMATVTPAFLSQMPLINLPSLETLIVMGDLSDMKYMNWWTNYTKVYNGYGPTECTIGSTIHRYNIGDDPHNIGLPFDGYSVFILDDNLIEVDTNEIGEICISGAGVATGYHNIDAITNQKFINTKYGRIYRTGDLGKKLSNGEIYFLGRVDNQIKINGIRCELEEIDSLAMTINNIDRAFSVYYNDKIHLFYQAEKEILSSTIRSILSQSLHRAVLPVSYNYISKFKLTHNGKIDKTGLIEILNTRKITSIESISESPTWNSTQTIVAGAFSFSANLPQNSLRIDSNFFEIGGTSLDIHKVVSYLKNYSINITAIDLMMYPTILKLDKYINNSVHPYQDCQSETVSEIQDILNKDYFKISPFQKTLINHRILYPNDNSYNTIKIYSTDGINVDEIVNIITKVIDNHCTLKTKYLEINGDFFQRFDTDIKIQTVNIGSEKNVFDSLQKDYKKPFSIMTEPLVRIKVYCLNCGKIYLSIIKDGTIIDAYSENIIFDTMKCALNGNLIKNDPYRQIINIMYPDTFGKAEYIFWKSYLKNTEYSYFPNNYNLSQQNCSANRISKNIKINLHHIASYMKTTPYIILLTALGITIDKYTNCKDVIFGTQIADRNDGKNIDCVGFFVSTLLVRMQIDGNSTIKSAIKKMHKMYTNIYQNKNITYDTLLQIIDNPAEIMFVYQNILQTKIIDHNEIIINEIDTNLEKNIPFPITWYIYQNNDEINIDIQTFYESEFITAVVNTFVDVLDGLINGMPEQPINQIHLSCNKNTILTGKKYDIANFTADQLIDEICHKNPTRSAIKYSSSEADHLDSTLSYEELYLLTNKYAFTLKNKYGINEKNIIGVSLRKSKDFVVLLLAILKLGACYVPIDPDYPIDRIQYMIDDSQASIIITRNSYQNNIKHSRIIDINELDQSNDLGDEVKSESCSQDIAYIIYTSGSTGNPKACMIRHESIINVCKYIAHKLSVTSTDQIWSLTTISFDIMVLEVFMPLIQGATLLICPQCVASDPVAHSNWINYHRPSVIQATPTQYSLISKHITPNPNMRILVGGEQLNSVLANELLKITPIVYNVYGPSETTVWSTCEKITNHSMITIGKPIWNTTCILFNSKLEVVPEHVVGELYIGGIGVANGYYNRPEITNERFIRYSDNIYYKTGDLAKIVNKKIIYIGRNDFQIKIRGHRVELDEIIKTAEKHEQIVRATIRIFDGSNLDNILNQQKIIVLYVIVSDSNETFNIENFFDYMRSKLPLHAVPNFIIPLLRFPETLNGKINTKLLPSPYDTKIIRYSGNNKIIVPNNETEKKLHQVWCNLLGINEISIKESLFNVGFTSIMVPQAISIIKTEFNINLNAIELIKNLPIEKCALLIESKLQ